MNSAIRQYWWSGKSNKKGWHMLPWNLVCLPKTAGGMGFRDLSDFNIALLGKQLWRLICELDSLLGQIYCSKYFPSGNILDATRPTRGSFAWQGLYTTLQQLYNDFLYRPGINSNIRVHKDNWGGFSPINLSGDYEISEEVHVRCRDFMLRNQMTWDPSKVRSYFNLADAYAILHVPIINDTQDSILWSPNDSGIYSVRSGYLFLQRSPEPRNTPTQIWKVLAKIKALLKVKTFGWRMASEALPVGSRLRAFSPNSEPCPICGFSSETTLHALRDCPGASEALHLSGVPAALYRSAAVNTIHWLEEAAHLLSADHFGLFLTTIWNIWNRHNDWRPPPHDHLKINVDGDFDPATRTAAVGVMARDATGAIVGGLAYPLGSCLDAATCEGLGLLAGITFAQPQGWQQLLFETDCASLANRLNNPGPNLSTLVPLLPQIRDSLLPLPFPTVSYVSREANSVAHALATHALSTMSSMSFGSDIPSCIIHLVKGNFSN
ncbi:hypothetical protein like AT4G29090 [Hibiscus trionum]|uniref:RNase H type-1 domain-containing protein n=1 Tax=Hibiscus trionum TaxID=183268 RepID=A0A9W7GTF4_HIBTR|nr:hypothetical protein like AT4G29090 [Hibiscus trionum]